jgi:hypothetical protein
VVDADEKTDGENDLQRDGKPPVERRRHEREAKVDPVGNGGSSVRAKGVRRAREGKRRTRQAHVAIMLASMQTRRPRLCERDVSATQDGMVAVFIPAHRKGRKSATYLPEKATPVRTVSDSSDDTTDAELDTSLVPTNGRNLDRDTDNHNNCSRTS